MNIRHKNGTTEITATQAEIRALKSARQTVAVLARNRKASPGDPLAIPDNYDAVFEAALKVLEPSA